MSPVSAKHFDIALVGSGIASTLTLLKLSEKLLKENRTGKKIQIAVIEKEGEFWTGIAYGSRSTVNSLIISSLKDFIHAEDKAPYIRWLETNRHKWIHHLKMEGGETAAKWVRNNESLLDNKQWDDIYIPRYLYGKYNSEKVLAALEALKKENIAEVTMLQAEVTDIIPTDDGLYEIVLETPENKTGSIIAKRPVVAVGSPPVKSILSKESAARKEHFHLNDIYVPCELSNLKKIQAVLQNIKEKEKRNILVMGSNASSLEFLYLLNNRPELRNLVNKIVIFSHSGMLPYKITNEDTGFHFEQLEQLKEREGVSALDLINSIKKDIQRAEDQKINIANIFVNASAIVVEIIKKMDIVQQEEFFCHHGMTFTKLIRRAGHEYRGAADELVADGKLEMVKGVFHEVIPSSAGSAFAEATYAKKSGTENIAYPLPFAVSINCGGFEELHLSSSRLISNLVNKKVCQVNSTQRGFYVNEQFEANKDLYIIGPLVGGNFNSKIRFWHAESAPRIFGLAISLAQILSDSLFQ